MDPTRDNPLIRFKAFIDGLGIFTFFAVLLLIVFGAAAAFSWLKIGAEPVEAAAKIRRASEVPIQRRHRFRDSECRKITNPFESHRCRNPDTSGSRIRDCQETRIRSAD